MEQTMQSFPGTSFQLRPRPTEPNSSIQSSSSDEPSSGLRTPPRRKSLPNPKNTKGPPAKINTSTTGSRSTKPASAGPRSGTNHGAIMQMSGTISPAQEITYTPTTHRISKAKKGKKVHACEYPGCTKIFTRAEHRKRHEANHNAVPLFQCEMDGCRKPFQRADLLTRHMERQHNMPIASPPSLNQDTSRSNSVISTAHSNPTTPSIVRPSIPPPSLGLSQPMANPIRAMSITSIVEPSMRHDYSPYANFTDTSHLPIPPAPRNFPSDLVYGMPASESPYLSSDSCNSPGSDFIQPQIANQSYLPDDIPRAHSAGLDCGFPQTVYASPMSAAASVPSWNFDHAPLSAPMQGSGMQGLAMSAPTRHYQYPSPTYMSPETMAAPGMPYDMGSMPLVEWGVPFRKMTY